MGGVGAHRLVGHGRGRAVSRMLGLLAAGAAAAAMVIGLAGDARPTPDWSGVVGRNHEDPAASDTPAAGVQYDELAAAPHVVPAKLVVVRPHSIDSVAAGVLVQRTYREGRAVSPVGLAAAVPQGWITLAGDVLRLNAAVQLTSGARFDVDGVRTLEMAGG